MALAFAIGLTLPAALPALAAGITGAIWTTNSTGTVVNQNIYGDKGDVYLNGGPTHSGAPGLPGGYYYVQVTTPNGTTVLGKSNTAVAQVSGGNFFQLYQLVDILYTSSSGFTIKGYDDTTNQGGEYKVWVSQNSAFPANESKTDNFKVKEGGGANPGEINSKLNVIKFYDANANGINDDGQLITGWKISIEDSIDYIRYTPVLIVIDPDTYIVSEFLPVETCWMPTTNTSVSITLAKGDEKTVVFGNLCLGPGGAKSKGFWGNKNGQALFGTDDLAAMVALNLRNANGGVFDPTSYAPFKAWLQDAAATNMAYMLSAQLAAMKLNVLNGFVNGSALVYAPGTTSANPLGFATVNALMTEANAELGLHGSTLSSSPYRAYQEALKDALDNANNNKTFVQPGPCPFNFP